MHRPSSIDTCPPTEPASGLLVATLIAGLLAAAASVLITSGRTAHEVSAEDRRLEQARFQAEAMVAAAIVRLDSEKPDLPLDGEPVSLPEVAGKGVVRLQDTAGLIDLNAAEPAQLAKLIQALGASTEAAVGLADRIADWRDPDDIKRLHGAEGSDYLAAGLAPPGNRPFRLESELGDVMGVTPSLLACLAPYVTVYSSSSTVDAVDAPGVIKSATGLASFGGSGTALGPPIGHAVIVSADAPLSEKSAYRLTEWIRLTGDARHPVMIHKAQSEFVSMGAPAPSITCAASLKVAGS